MGVDVETISPGDGALNPTFPCPFLGLRLGWVAGGIEAGEAECGGEGGAGGSVCLSLQEGRWECGLCGEGAISAQKRTGAWALGRRGRMKRGMGGGVRPGEGAILEKAEASF